MVQRHRNPKRTAWTALLVLLLGFVAMVVDFRQRSDTTGRNFFRVQGIWGIIGLALAGVGVVSWLAVHFTSRCPFCGKWINPWYYPRRGVHCPKCGKTTE